MTGLAMANAEHWAQARLIAYYSIAPHLKKGKKLKLSDIIELPLIDGVKKKKRTTASKVYRLTPEEIKQWHAGTWVPPDETEPHDNSTTT